ncbi:MAG: hypothetical protein JJU10_05440 [Idiomarina sp.]|nr:hypothetical protein [Idiomarina sp.]
MPSVTPAVQAAIDGRLPKCQLFKFALANITLHLTTAGHDVQWGGVTYISNGYILDFDEIKKNTEIRVAQRRITLDGVNQDLIAEFEGTTQINRPVTQWTAYLDDDGQLIPDPIHEHTWDIIDHQINSKNTSRFILVSVASEWANFEAQNGRHTTTRSQQRYFPGDLGFDFAPDTNKPVIWGDE